MTYKRKLRGRPKQHAEPYTCFDVVVPESQMAAVRKLAHVNRMPVSAVVREALTWVLPMAPGTVPEPGYIRGTSFSTKLGKPMS